MGLTNQPNPTKGIIIMDKFTSQIQVEDTADFQAWLDAQEVADIRAMEAEEAEALAGVRAAARRQFGGTRRFDASRAFAAVIAKTAKGWN
jgi:hypothetical protein